MHGSPFYPKTFDYHMTAIVLFLQLVCNELLQNTESDSYQLFRVCSDLCVCEENK